VQFQPARVEVSCQKKKGMGESLTHAFRAPLTCCPIWSENNQQKFVAQVFLHFNIQLHAQRR
jgi:hypothetical protein